MDLNNYSPETRKYILELMRRNAIGPNALDDKIFINFLASQKFDEDYIRSMMKDR